MHIINVACHAPSHTQSHATTVSYKYRSIIIIFLGVCSAIIRPFAILLISMIIVINYASSSCDCESSAFPYESHGYVITGDLRIVTNRTLRRLLEKGPKYREQNIIDWHLNKMVLITAIDDYAKNEVNEKDTTCQLWRNGRRR